MRTINYKEPSKSLEKMAAPNFEGTSRSSLGMEKFVGEYFYLETDDLIPFRKQARKQFNEKEIEELASTIKAHGIRQPLTVVKTEDNKFEVVSGERRLRAAKSIGLTKVPCIILQDQDQAEEIALIENVQRKDLHTIELARGLRTLVDKLGKGAQLELEKRIGIPQPHISTYLGLLALPLSIQDLAIERNFTGRDNLSSLLKLKNESEMRVRIEGHNKGDQVVRSSFSILRLSFTMGELKVQNGAFKKLDSNQKKRVKDQLLKLIDELS